jgi:hypothetical protein
MGLNLLSVWIMVARYLLEMATAMFAARPNSLCAMGVCEVLVFARIPALS